MCVDDIESQLQRVVDSNGPVVDQSMFAVVIESCVDEGRLDGVLDLVRKMEIQLDLSPDRRIYASLIRAFGQNGDVASALGVFQEMRKLGCYVPDVQSLDSLLEICCRNPSDLRHICPVLEEMAEDPAIDLEVYSKDILMQGFSDGFKLGSALMAMEEMQPLYPGQPSSSRISASFPVISVLAQAVRSRGDELLTTKKGASLEETLIAALYFLGSIGILPDEETMDYFRIPDLPSKGSPNSRHFVQSLLPHRQKVRSLMDIEMPEGFGPDVSAVRTYQKTVLDRRTVEPYFENGVNNWQEHSQLLQTVLPGTVGMAGGLLDAPQIFEMQGMGLLSQLASSALQGDVEGEGEGDADNEEIGRILRLKDTAVLEELSAMEQQGGAGMPLEIKEEFLRQAKPTLAVRAQQVRPDMVPRAPSLLQQGSSRDLLTPSSGRGSRDSPEVDKSLDDDRLKALLPKVVYKVKGVARDKVLADEARNKKRMKQQKRAWSGVKSLSKASNQATGGVVASQNL